MVIEISNNRVFCTQVEVFLFRGIWKLSVGVKSRELADFTSIFAESIEHIWEQTPVARLLPFSCEKKTTGSAGGSGLL